MQHSTASGPYAARVAFTALPVPDLGGRRASWLWRTATDELTEVPDAAAAASIPVGLNFDHGDHNSIILWAPVDVYPAAFSVESLAPLTIAEPVHCPICGVVGWIAGGQWVPTSSPKDAAA